VVISHIAVASANSAQWVQLLSVAGMGGVLTALGVAGGPDYHHFQLEVDGSVVADDYLAGTGNSTHVNNGIGTVMPFSNRLVVRVKDEPAPSSLAKYWATCITYGLGPTGEEATRVERVDGRPQRFRAQEFANGDGEPYVIETLMGPQRTAEIRLASDWTVLGEFSRRDGGHVRLDGEVLLSDADADGREEVTGAPVTVRLPGRHTVVDEAVIGGPEAPARIWVPAPGEYLIATNYEEHANIPAFFTVL
jgi:hypothetical protein